MSRFKNVVAGNQFCFADIDADSVDAESDPNYVIVTIKGQQYGIPSERWNESSKEDDVILYRGRTDGYQFTLYPEDATKAARSGFKR